MGSIASRGTSSKEGADNEECALLPDGCAGEMLGPFKLTEELQWWWYRSVASVSCLASSIEEVNHGVDTDGALGWRGERGSGCTRPGASLKCVLPIEIEARWRLREIDADVPGFCSSTGASGPCACIANGVKLLLPVDEEKE